MGWPSFTGGVFVAAGDVTGSGYDDIVVGADAGGGPQVNIFDGKSGALLDSFYATSPNFTGGVRVACGDLNGDGYADVIAAAGLGGGPQVTIFDGKSMKVLGAFYDQAANFMGGLYAGTADANADGFADVVIGVDQGAPQVSVFSGPSVYQFLKTGMGPTVLSAFYAFPTSFTGGVRVDSVPDTDSPNLFAADILVGAGPGGAPQVNTVDPTTGAVQSSLFAFATNFTGGVYVSGDWFQKV